MADELRRIGYSSQMTDGKKRRVNVPDYVWLDYDIVYLLVIMIMFINGPIKL